MLPANRLLVFLRQSKMPFHRIWFLGCFALVLCFAVSTRLSAQEKNPYAGDPKVAKLGEYQFRVNCAFCHGLGARGGGRGPDLTRAKRHGSSDAEVFHNIHDGITGTAMPSATNGGIGVGMSDEEIWQVVTYIRSVEVKAPAQAAGNAAHGKELFFGTNAACSTCHMIEGKGGRLGPDLSAVGASRSTEYLVESVRNPSKRLAQGILEAMKEFPQQYESVSVVTADGTKYAGVVLNEDQFTLQMLDTREQLHLLEKDKLRTFEKHRESAMPAYDQKLLSDKDLQDLIAFLQAAGAQ